MSPVLWLLTIWLGVGLVRAVYVLSRNFKHYKNLIEQLNEAIDAIRESTEQLAEQFGVAVVHRAHRKSLIGFVVKVFLVHLLFWPLHVVDSILERC